MIKANELRVGNWITSQYKEKPFKVTGGLIAAMDDGMDEYSLEGIPLTPEILGRAGFEEIYKSPMHTTFYKDKISYYFWHKTNKQYADMGGNQYDHIKHLHQLQNLYFALTGEELTLDLCTNA
jgi:hypothetical protein